MRTIIAGSRTVTSYLKVCEVIDNSGWVSNVTEVVCGMAAGVDLLGRRWALQQSIPIKEFPVTSDDWLTLGRSAGHQRNREMADYASAEGPGALILVWDGSSRGSLGMLQEARLAGLKIFAPCLRCWSRPTDRNCPFCRGVGHFNSPPRALFSEEI